MQITRRLRLDYGPRWTGYARNALLAVSAGLLAAAVLPWGRLLGLAAEVSGRRWALMAAAGVCGLLAAWWHRALPKPGISSAARPLRPISWWWMVMATAAIGAVVWGTTAWMLSEANDVEPTSEQAKVRIDAARTGLATGGGVGAAVALLLAFRRQHHAEVISASTFVPDTPNRSGLV